MAEMYFLPSYLLAAIQMDRETKKTKERERDREKDREWERVREWER